MNVRLKMSPGAMPCDFCYTDVLEAERFTVPARDFDIPQVDRRSVGPWIACKSCAACIQTDDWEALVKRGMLPFQADTVQELRHMEQWMRLMFIALETHMTGPVRPWRAGDFSNN